MELTWCENELNQQLSSLFYFWSPGNRGNYANDGRFGCDVGADLTSVGLRWLSVTGRRAPAIDFEIQISELSFSENFALTLISIWLEAIGTEELSWTYHCTHTLGTLEKPKITSNKLSGSICCINAVCFLFGKVSSFSEKVFFCDFGPNSWEAKISILMRDEENNSRNQNVKQWKWN